MSGWNMMRERLAMDENVLLCVIILCATLKLLSKNGILSIAFVWWWWWCGAVCERCEIVKNAYCCYCEAKTPLYNFSLRKNVVICFRLQCMQSLPQRRWGRLGWAGLSWAGERWQREPFLVRIFIFVCKYVVIAVIIIIVVDVVDYLLSLAFNCNYAIRMI